MNLLSLAQHALRATALLTIIAAVVQAQVKESVPLISATSAAAEMTNGRLNPSQTRPGHEVSMRLKDDVKSNGEVVLKRGTTITGVVRTVKNLESAGEGSRQVQSMMVIEWFTPPVQGKAMTKVSIALQSVIQVKRIHEQGQTGVEGTSLADSVTAVTDGVGSRDVSALRSGPTTPVANTGQPISALWNMPSVTAVDQRTAADFESSFGANSLGQLFRVGHGELVSEGGSKQAVELFSHLRNDTMITSPSKNFEISSGAQIRLLVGVSKQ